METRTEISPWLILATIAIMLFCLTAGVTSWFGRFDLHLGSSPDQQAAATVQAQVAPAATATAVYWVSQHAAIDVQAHQVAALSQAQRQTELDQAFGVVLWSGVAALVGAIGVLLAGYAIWFFSRVQLNVRANRLPARRIIGPHIQVIETPYGPFLLDTLTGQRSLLRNRSGVSTIRAALIAHQDLANITASAAVQIAQYTHSDPKEWLPAMSRPPLPVTEIRPIVATYEPDQAIKEK